MAQLQQHCEDWQVGQALRLYRYFLSSQQAERKPLAVEGDPAAWHELFDFTVLSFSD